MDEEKTEEVKNKNKIDFDVLKKYTERIENSPTQKILKEINSIKWSFKIFHGNYNELIKPLKILEDEPKAMKLWDAKKKKELYRVFEEIGRLLFNYLAAAFMLKDHTRRYVDRMYKGEKYSMFKKAQGLRNYIQHRNLPTVGSVISYNPKSGLNKMFRIPMESLLAWDGWSPLAEEKLRAMGENFHISRFVEEYFHQVEAFHKWLWDRQVELHREDIEQLNRLKKEAREAFIEAVIGTEEEFKEH